MKILVGCEVSQVLTSEFRAMGHLAYSCDIQPTYGLNKEWHIRGNILDYINNDWDMLVAFPPCIYLSSVQSHLCRNDMKRTIKRIEAASFFMQLMNAEIPKICLENPAGVMANIYRKPDQMIHPYYFGESEMKRTCLWLKGLPRLVHNKERDLFSVKTHCNKPAASFSWVNKKGKLKKEYFTYNKNGAERSLTFGSIANAMAFQWS